MGLEYFGMQSIVWKSLCQKDGETGFVDYVEITMAIVLMILWIEKAMPLVLQMLLVTVGLLVVLLSVLLLRQQFVTQQFKM